MVGILEGGDSGCKGQYRYRSRRGAMFVGGRGQGDTSENKKAWKIVAAGLIQVALLGGRKWKVTFFLAPNFLI